MKYKLILVTLLLAQTSFGQTLKDFFLEIPIGGLTIDEKELMIDNFLNKKKGLEHGIGSQKHYLISFQPKNGYLSFTGAYEGSGALTYWNLSNGNKLVGVEYSSCGGACNSNLTFYLKTTENLIKLSLYDVIPKIGMTDFFDTDQMIKDGINEPISNKDFIDFYDFLYYLPSKGKNIIVESQTHDLGAIPDKYKKYDLGPKIILEWNDGTFIKHKNGL